MLESGPPHNETLISGADGLKDMPCYLFVLLLTYWKGFPLRLLWSEKSGFLDFR